MTVALNIGLPDGFQVNVETTEGRGFTPEEIAQRAAQKIVSVSDTAPPVIRDQARAFQKQVAQLVEFYLREAVKSDRTTVYNVLVEAGHPKLAEHIRSL